METPVELTHEEKIAKIKTEFSNIARNLGIYTHEYENNKAAFLLEMTKLETEYKELTASEEVTDGNI